MTSTPRHQLRSKICLVRLGLREDFLRNFPVLYYHSTLNDHFVFVVLICYWFCAALLIFTNA